MEKALPRTVSAWQERWVFFKRWFAHPRQLGSLVPSSQALARFMAASTLKELAPGDHVLELGAGTGRFSQALLDAGLPEERLWCVEIDPILSQGLALRFPNVHVLQGNACALETLLPEWLHQKIGVVVSGIPMLALSKVVQQKIVEGCFQILKEKGIFLQFTYSPFSSIQANRFALEKKRLGTVFRNCPPASVWSYTQVDA